jgi:hypothetical protein
MSKKVLIDAFYNQFQSFLTQLVTMYPEDAEFGVFLDNLKFAKMMNPMLPVTLIKSEILDNYSEKIEKHDETFFMNHEYDSHKDVDLDIVNKLRSYYGDMSPQSREVVWGYIDVITRITSKILSM